MKLLWRPRRRSALAGMIVAIGVELLLGGTTSAAQSSTTAAIPSTLPGTQLPSLPGSGASMLAWDAWAGSQRSAIESQPYAAMLAAQGLEIKRLFFVTTTKAPGVPAGVSTVAAVVIAAPLSSGAASRSTQAVSPSTTNFNCSGFSNGLGSACIYASNESGGLEWEASSELYVATTGKLNLGDGGCPGQQDVVTTGLISVTAYETVQIYYGPVAFDQTWDSRWWDDSTGTFKSWGYACLTE